MKRRVKRFVGIGVFGALTLFFLFSLSFIGPSTSNPAEQTATEFQLPSFDGIINLISYSGNTGCSPDITLFDDNNRPVTLDTSTRSLRQLSTTDVLGRTVDAGRIEMSMSCFFEIEDNKPIRSWQLSGSITINNNDIPHENLILNAFGTQSPSSEFPVLLNRARIAKITIIELKKDWVNGQNNVSINLVEAKLDVTKTDGEIETAEITGRELALLTFNSDLEISQGIEITARAVSESTVTTAQTVSESTITLEELETDELFDPSGVDIRVEFQVRDGTSTRSLNNVHMNMNGQDLVGLSNVVTISGQTRESSLVTLKDLPSQTELDMSLQFPDAEKSGKTFVFGVNSDNGRNLLVVDDRTTGTIFCNGCVPDIIVYRTGFGGEILIVKSSGITEKIRKIYDEPLTHTGAPIKIKLSSGTFTLEKEVSKINGYKKFYTGPEKTECWHLASGNGMRCIQRRPKDSTINNIDKPAIFTDKEIPPNLWGKTVGLSINGGAYKTAVKLGTSDGQISSVPRSITLNPTGSECTGCNSEVVKLASIIF